MSHKCKPADRIQVTYKAYMTMHHLTNSFQAANDSIGIQYLSMFCDLVYKTKKILFYAMKNSNISFD